MPRHRSSTSRIRWQRWIRPADVIVRCPRGHRVRLARGRWWRAARCGACRGRVDPWRIRRLLESLRHLAFPASAVPRHRALWIATAGYLAFVCATALAVWVLSDRWWPATTLLFGPRWILALPVAILAAVVVALDRPLLPMVLAAGLVVAGPIVGLRTGWRAWLTFPDPDRDLRVVTFNAMGGNNLRLGADALLREWRPDVLLVQECGDGFASALRAQVGWELWRHGRLCVVSRLPIQETRVMDREAFRAAGGAGLVATAQIAHPDGPLLVTNLHLDTPRSGLARIREGDLDPGIARLESKSTLRAIELARARQWVDGFEGRHIVGGDFNTPAESPIYRRAWGEWQNAFSVAGRGLGGTRLNGWIRARIDHVVADESWTIVAARRSADVGSDHAALIADLRPRDAAAHAGLR